MAVSLGQGEIDRVNVRLLPSVETISTTPDGLTARMSRAGRVPDVLPKVPKLVTLRSGILFCR
jgi:hypothetical protein